MAASDLRTYVEQLLRRFNPDVDLSAGSPAQTELIDPLIDRIGPDPFDLDLAVFIQARVKQSFPDLAISEVDDLTDTLIGPMQVLLEPIVREIKLAKVRSDLRNYERMADDEADALLANFFESRQVGGFATGQIRIYYASAQAAYFTQTNIAVSKGGLRFLPTVPQQITADEMFFNRDGSEYYVDINYIAEARGDEYNLDVDQIVSISNLPSATRSKNLRRFRNGVVRETTAQFVARSQQSVSDKTLTVERGIARTLGEAFPSMRRLFVVGYKDPEMQRDLITGGAFGAIREADAYGVYYGSGWTDDDLIGTVTTRVVEVTGAALVSRLGPVGSDPEAWYLTLVYQDPDTTAQVALDTRIVEILSDTSARVDTDLPYRSSIVSTVWMLRKKEITLSDMPGGIVLPTSADGTTLEISPDSVHVGGRTDVYVAGATETATASITRLTDEMPLAQGVSAETDTTADPSLIKLWDITLPEQLVLLATPAELSLVLESGVDSGAYPILNMTYGIPFIVRVGIDTTGNQNNLRWRITDEIDLNLVEPKSVRITGADLVLAAGNQYVSAVSGTNWVDADVRPGDTVRVLDTEVGAFSTDYQVAEVSPTTLKVAPTPVRTFSSIGYTIFTPSNGVQTPVVRVKSMELADTAGAGSGTQIPYRDPVLAVSNSFQNEGQGYAYEGPAVLGLVTGGVASSGGTFAVGSLTMQWRIAEATSAWNYIDSGTITFTAGAKSPAALAAEIMASSLATYVRTRIDTVGAYTYVGIISKFHVVVNGGTGLAALGWGAGYSNAAVRAFGSPRLWLYSKIGRGDMIEPLGTRNTGRVGRVVAMGPAYVDLSTATNDIGLSAGYGPVGPLEPSTLLSMHSPTIYTPEIGETVRIGRPAVGSARVYFLGPTSAEVDSANAVFTTRGLAADYVFMPDPENKRQLLPYVTQTTLPGTTATTGAGTRVLTDPDATFVVNKIKSGDILEILYNTIRGSVALPGSGNVTISGLTLSVQLDGAPAVSITFPYDMTRQQVLDYINAQLAVDIATVDGTGRLLLDANTPLVLDPGASTSLATFGITTYTNTHPDAGIYVISIVGDTTLEIANRMSTFVGDALNLSCRYTVYRHMQRISSTEMNSNTDASGLYYMDVQLVSTAPGDSYNIGASVELAVTGHRSDGYRVTTDNSTLSYSRAEILRAEISPSMIVVGSLDSPTEAIQLSQKDILVTYDRSPVVDEIQSYCDSTFNRVVVEDMLIRHLFPNYVSANFYYVGGGGEAEMRRGVNRLLEEVEPGDELELTDVVRAFTRQGAVSVYTVDAAAASGRSAPTLVIVYHQADRTVSAQLVRDQVSTTRTRRFIPDAISLRRVSTSGIR